MLDTSVCALVTTILNSFESSAIENSAIDIEKYLFSIMLSFVI